MRSSATSDDPRAGGPLLAAGVVLAALNLRIAVASVPPVLDELERRFGLSATTAGLLTGAPVLCFGLLAPLAPALRRRLGDERVLLAALAVLGAGILVRAAPSVVALFGGTLVAGGAIAVCNVIGPGFIKGRFPGRVGLLTGLYATGLGAGAALAGGATVPLEHGLGGGWQPALAVWALPAALAILVLRAGAGHGRTAPRAALAPRRARALLGDRVAWQVTLYFGLQSALFYSGLAWLPSLLRDAGHSHGEAGALLALFAIGGVPASLGVPVLAGRMRDQRFLAAAVTTFFAAGFAGLLAAPGGAYVWVALLALGQGGSIGLALSLVVLRAPDARRATELSGMAQGFGYCLAAGAPVIVGAVHDGTGGWHTPLALLLAITVPLLAVGVGAGRSRTVLAIRR